MFLIKIQKYKITINIYKNSKSQELVMQYDILIFHYLNILAVFWRLFHVGDRCSAVQSLAHAFFLKIIFTGHSKLLKKWMTHFRASHEENWQEGYSFQSYPPFRGYQIISFEQSSPYCSMSSEISRQAINTGEKRDEAVWKD